MMGIHKGNRMKESLLELHTGQGRNVLHSISTTMARTWTCQHQDGWRKPRETQTNKSLEAKFNHMQILMPWDSPLQPSHPVFSITRAYHVYLTLHFEHTCTMYNFIMLNFQQLQRHSVASSPLQQPAAVIQPVVVAALDVLSNPCLKVIVET